MSRRLLPQALVVGLVVGLTAGLVYAWVINPLQFTNTYPSLLREDFRREWVRLAALSYAAGDSLARTRARVEGLNEQDIAQALGSLIEEHASGGSPDTLHRLTELAAALDADIPPEMITRGPSVSASAAFTRTPSPSTTPRAAPSSTSTPSPTTPPATETWTPSPTESATPSETLTATASPSPSPTPTRVPSNTPTPTHTPAPTDTPTPTSSPTAIPSRTPTRRPTATPTRTSTPTPSPTPPFVRRLEVQARDQLCGTAEPLRIEVVVLDEDGEGVPAVVVWLAWAQGVDRAVTGLKPDKGLGYVDFGAQPNINYSISVGQLEMPLLSGLRLESCPAEGADEEPVLGSWRIVLAPEE